LTIQTEIPISRRHGHGLPKTNEVESSPLRLNTAFFALTNLNAEVVLYFAIFALAIFSRIYLLGERVMSHDESLHTLYSWNLYAGKGYIHDPLMHGPTLFHFTAFMYFLFGDNDFTARLSPAIAGIILVMLPFMFRPWLGRVGAIATSMLILISPGIMYYSRYIRHDTFIELFGAMMVLSVFSYMRTRHVRWLYIGLASAALILATAEMSYIYGFIFFNFLVFTWLWESLRKSQRQILEIGLITVILILGSLATFLISQAVPGDEAAPMTSVAFLTFHLDAIIATFIMMIANLSIKFTTDTKNRPLSQAIGNFYEHRFDLGKAFLLYLIITAIFDTTVFSNIRGLYTGSWGEIDYWLKQHGVQRGGQPWFYYLLLMPLYEFLPLFVGVIGSLVYLFSRQPIPTHINHEEELPTGLYPSDGGMFFGMVAYWAIGTFTVFSWAGEKMPWLTVHLTLPLAFLAGHIIQTALGRFDWLTAYQKGSVKLGAAILLITPALVALLTSTPFQSQSIQSVEQTSKFLAALVVLVCLLWVIVQAFRDMGLKIGLQTTFATILIILTLFTIRTAWMFNFINYDYVSEPLVYAHAAPDVKIALTQIEEISRRTVGDKMIKVAYDSDSTWPLEWYLREYPNRSFYGENPNRTALDAPIVIVGSVNESKVKPYLGEKYTRFDYRLVWWPLEDYKTITLDSLRQSYFSGSDAEPDPAIRAETVSKNRASLAKIIFYRSYDNYKLNEWPFVHRFALYVRNDVLNEVWDYHSGPLQLTQAAGGVTDPYEGKRTETQALQSWGSGGMADGQFNKPRNLAIAPDGNIYVADSGNHRIEVFDKNGTFLFKWGNESLDPSKAPEPSAEPGKFNEPWGIAVGPSGKVYVTDTWNHRIQIFTAKGEFIRQVGTFVNAQSDPNLDPQNFWGPRGLAVDKDGNFYVTDTGNKRVQKFTADGEFVKSWGGGGLTAGNFDEPVGISLDSLGNIYVADTWNHRVQKFDTNLAPVAEWEVKGWESESIFNKPSLVIDKKDQVIISDPENYRLVVYTNTGQIVTTWGQFGQDLSSFGLPNGLAIDSEGNLLVADADNNRIMKFKIPGQ